jgi:hypothetical protein
MRNGTAGLINGRFGSGDRLDVAAWKTKKRVIRTEESEDEKTIISEREQFVTNWPSRLRMVKRR